MREWEEEGRRETACERAEDVRSTMVTPRAPAARNAWARLGQSALKECEKDRQAHLDTRKADTGCSTLLSIACGVNHRKVSDVRSCEPRMSMYAQ